MSGSIYGVDLGTTFTKCALVRPEDGVVRVFKLDADQRGSPEMLRSTVTLSIERERKVAYVGSKAWSQFAKWDADSDPPYRRFEESKLWIGEEAAADGEAPPWTFAPHRWDYRPEDVGALVLRKVMLEVERDRSPTMERVVITHPQFFTEARREATRQAAAIAGLNVVDTLTEPDAAAIAFGRDATPGTYMVFDLGGGTLDVTVVKLRSDQRTEVLTSEGERRGGRDWDRSIVERMIEFYQGKLPSFSPDLLDEATRQDWMRKAEQIKLQLTDDGRPDAVAGEHIECKHEDFEGMRPHFRLCRSEFDRITQTHVDACRRCVERALANKRLGWKDLQGILLVGGSTRLRAVREMLVTVSGHELNTNIDPSTAVAQGAAIYAHRLERRGRAVSASIAPPPGAAGPPAHGPAGIAVREQYTGALARGFGVKAWDRRAGRYVIVNLIPKDSPLPSSRAQRFETQAANQTVIEVELWEGEDVSPEGCERVGVCALTGIAPGPAGQPVDVTIDVHANGSKHITVAAGGKRREQVLRFDEARVLPPDALAERAAFVRSIDVR